MAFGHISFIHGERNVYNTVREISAFHTASDCVRWDRSPAVDPQHRPGGPDQVIRFLIINPLPRGASAFRALEQPPEPVGRRGRRRLVSKCVHTSPPAVHRIRAFARNSIATTIFQNHQASLADTVSTRVSGSEIGFTANLKSHRGNFFAAAFMLLPEHTNVLRHRYVAYVRRFLLSSTPLSTFPLLGIGYHFPAIIVRYQLLRFCAFKFSQRRLFLSAASPQPPGVASSINLFDFDHHTSTR